MEKKMIDSRKINILGNVLNATFGKSAIRERGYAVNHNLSSVVDNSLDADGANVNKLILNLRFETAYNFSPKLGMTEQKKSLDKESVEVLNKALKEIKKDFKDKSGQTLKVKELEVLEPIMESISFNPGLIRGRYRRQIIFELEFK